MVSVAEIWRYPVKSMAGERLDRVEVTELGLEGDRRYAWLDTAPNRRGKQLTARELDRLLAYRATGGLAAVSVTNPSGEARPLEAGALRQELESLARRQLHLIDRPGANFDDSPVLVVNPASLSFLEPALGLPVDRRRFRANFYLAGVEPDGEQAWLGQELRVGAALLRVVKPCERCVVPTLDPDTQERAPRLLQVLTEQRATRMGVYCEVVEPGSVAVGDPCEVL